MVSVISICLLRRFRQICPRRFDWRQERVLELDHLQAIRRSRTSGRGVLFACFQSTDYES
jgi:hypothetical protein